MQEHFVIMVAGISALAFSCQWVAWRIKLPAIIFLLAAGILIGPTLGWVNPDKEFGELLLPFVSLSVAIILFEGSLTLNFAEVRSTVRVVQWLVTLGAVITWITIAAATHWLLAYPWQISFLFGAIVVVSGPTVIIPLLKTVRPNAQLSRILKWEGILIDPIGALLSVAVFEFIVSQSQTLAFSASLILFFQIIVVGMMVGFLAGRAVGVVLVRQWIPEYLHNLMVLTVVFGIFAFSNMLAPEAGLLAVTVMGMVLANLPGLKIREILHFKENLTLVLISGLFIILAARLDFAQLTSLGATSLLVVGIIQFVARPLAVMASTIGSPLSWQERLFLSWIAPRGIVAAAISAVFAFRLEELGFPGAEQLVALTFLVIISTVVLQSGTARLVAHILGVADPEPKGYLIIGANAVARVIGKMLSEMGYRVVLTDSAWENISAARMEGLQTFFGNPISEYADRNLDLVGVGRLLALSPQRELNLASCMRYRMEFDSENVFALQTSSDANASEKHQVAQEFQGNVLFAKEVTYSKLASLISQGAEIRKTKLTDSFSYEQYCSAEGVLIPLVAVNAKGLAFLYTDEIAFKPESGWTIVGLVEKSNKSDKKESQ